MAFVTISELKEHIGKEVRLRGWLYNRRSKGKLAFLILRDGTGIVQCVAFKKDVPEAVFERATAVKQESSLTVAGTVREDARSPGGVGSGAW